MNTHTTVDIVILEDDPNDLELTLRALRGCCPDSKIFTAVDGVEALDYLFVDGESKIQQIIDFPKLILVDLKVPKVNGLEFIRTVKSHPVLKIIPIVVFSSSNQEQDIVSAYNYGANAYIVKPVRFEQYQHIISQTALFWVSVNRFLR